MFKTWFRKYFGRIGKKMAMGTSVGSQGADVYQKVCSELVLATLADERFHYRTVPNISAETGLPEASVQALLEQHKGEVRKVALHDGKGNFLYTLRSRSRTAREILAETRASLAGSSQ